MIQFDLRISLKLSRWFNHQLDHFWDVFVWHSIHRILPWYQPVSQDLFTWLDYDGDGQVAVDGGCVQTWLGGTNAPVGWLDTKGGGLIFVKSEN